MADHSCSYCKHDFKSQSALEKQTGCISWRKMNDMFSELTTSKKVLHEQFLKSIVNFKKELERYEAIIQFQKEQISQLAAENLMKAEAFKWEKITIVAPFLSPASKKQIKAIIEDIENPDDIKKTILTSYPKLQISQLIKRKKEIEVVLEDEELTECKICFEAKAQQKGKCKVCKVCYVCVDCELDQINKFKKCAFCNTDL